MNNLKIPSYCYQIDKSDSAFAKIVRLYRVWGIFRLLSCMQSISNPFNLYENSLLLVRNFHKTMRSFSKYSKSSDIRSSHSKAVPYLVFGIETRFLWSAFPIVIFFCQNLNRTKFYLTFFLLQIFRKTIWFIFVLTNFLCKCNFETASCCYIRIFSCLPVRLSNIFHLAPFTFTHYAVDNSLLDPRFTGRGP